MVRIKKIKIFAKIYKVFHVPRYHKELLLSKEELQELELNGGTVKAAAGCIKERNCQIFLNKNLGNDTYTEVLFHEAIHGIDIALGLELPEHLIRQLSVGIQAVLVDNPELTKKLLKRK